MKLIKHLTFGTLAALTVALLFQTPTTRAGVGNQTVPPSNRLVVLLEGTFGLANPNDVPDLGLVLPNLRNGVYQTVPIDRKSVV